MSDWISVETAVPRTNKEHGESYDVLVVIGDFGEQAVCWYNSKTDSFHVSHHHAKSDAVTDVTWWRPLPEPPK